MMCGFWYFVDIGYGLPALREWGSVKSMLSGIWMESKRSEGGMVCVGMISILSPRFMSVSLRDFQSFRHFLGMDMRPWESSSLTTTSIFDSTDKGIPIWGI